MLANAAETATSNDIQLRQTQALSQITEALGQLMTRSGSRNSDGNQRPINTTKLELDRVDQFDGSKKHKFFQWIDAVERCTRVIERSPAEVAQLKAKGAVHATMRTFDPDTPWDHIVAKLRMEFSDARGDLEAYQRLHEIRQKEGEGMREYIWRYTLYFRLIHQKEPTEERSVVWIRHFFSTLANRVISQACTRTNREGRSDLPPTLAGAFTRAINETESLVQQEAASTKSVKLVSDAGQTTDPPAAQDVGTAEVMEIKATRDDNPIAPAYICSHCGMNHPSDKCRRDPVKFRNQEGQRNDRNNQQRNDRTANRDFFQNGGTAATMLTVNGPAGAMDARTLVDLIKKELAEAQKQSQPQADRQASRPARGNDTARDRRRDRRQDDRPAEDAKEVKRDDKAWNQKTRYTSAGDTRTNDRDAPPKKPGRKGMSPLEKLVKAFQLLNEPESEEEEQVEHVKAMDRAEEDSAHDDPPEGAEGRDA